MAEKQAPGEMTSGCAWGVMLAPVVFIFGGKLLGWIVALLGG